MESCVPYVEWEMFIYIYISRSPTTEYLQYEPVSSNKIRNTWKKYTNISREELVKSNFEMERNSIRVCTFVIESDRNWKVIMRIQRRTSYLESDLWVQMRTGYLKCDGWSIHEDWLSQRRLWEYTWRLVMSELIMGTHMKFGYLKVFMGVHIKIGYLKVFMRPQMRICNLKYDCGSTHEDWLSQSDYGRSH
jgi:hypothetical protein